MSKRKVLGIIVAVSSLATLGGLLYKKHQETKTDESNGDLYGGKCDCDENCDKKCECFCHEDK